MKKTLAIVAALIMAGGAFAQKGTFYLGATGITFPMGPSESTFITGVVYNKNGSNSMTAFGIAPELGYFISDKWALGLGVGFNYYSMDNGSSSSNAITWGVNPYICYYAVTMDKFNLYFQGDLSYTSNKPEHFDASNIFYVGISPGISYDLSEKFCIYATFGNFGYYHYGNSTSSLSLQLDPNALSFGLLFLF